MCQSMDSDLRRNDNNGECGNAIFMILLGVALFAALGYAFMGSSRTSTTLLTDEQATTYANQIIAYSNEVKNAVKRLQLRGCDDDEISFENNVVAGYENTNAPTSKKCHVFDIAGGGVSWGNFQDLNAEDLIFTADNVIDNLGTAHLILATQNIPDGVCAKLNQKINPSLTTNPPSDTGTWSITKFDGDYSAGDNITNAGQGLEDLKAACFNDSAKNVFYQILINQ